VKQVVISRLGLFNAERASGGAVEHFARAVTQVAKLNQTVQMKTPVYQYAPDTWGPGEVERLTPPGGWQNPAGTESLAVAGEAA